MPLTTQRVLLTLWQHTLLGNTCKGYKEEMITCTSHLLDNRVLLMTLICIMVRNLNTYVTYFYSACRCTGQRGHQTWRVDVKICVKYSTK